MASIISSKLRVTIPVNVLEAAGFEVGDRLVARADGPGRIVLERTRDLLAEFAGALTGIYPASEVTQLRDEWT